MIDETPRPAEPPHQGSLFDHGCGHPGCNKRGEFECPGPEAKTTVWRCFEHRQKLPRKGW
jgi:hypothetical protein